jgi:hypothetical protein
MLGQGRRVARAPTSPLGDEGSGQSGEVGRPATLRPSPAPSIVADNSRGRLRTHLGGRVASRLAATLPFGLPTLPRCDAVQRLG